MQMTLELLLGLTLLIIGGDVLVRGAVAVARRMGVSELMIGLTLVGIGTSTPELVTSLRAAFAGSPGIAVGNVVGSNICNILLILGTAALIAPLTYRPEGIRRDGMVLLISTLSCVGLVLYGTLTRGLGIVFLSLQALYILITYLEERIDSSPSAELHRAESHLRDPVFGSIWISLLMVFGGIILTILGAKFLIEGAVSLAHSFGISEAVIGLSVVAVGTSLPELVTSVMATLRRNAEIAVGNVVGSNICNIWLILGTTAVVHPIPVPPSFGKLDIWVMLGVTLLLIGIVWKWKSLSRLTGFLFLVLYGSYLFLLF